MAEKTSTIVALELDERTVARRNAQVEHERRVAIFDLIENNHFEPVGCGAGPYRLRLGMEESRLIFDIRDAGDQPIGRVPLPIAPLRRVIKDYFTICDSYYEAIRHAPPSRIEAIDMGRRGLHNEGSAILKERLDGKIEIDHETARRLFTLICVLQIRQ